MHADFEISGGAAVTTRHYFGAGHADVDASGDWTDQAIAFGNQIGSTELLTDANGQVTQDWAYTAFGEPADLDGPGGPAVGQSRYGYAGDWGYETNSKWPIANGEFPFLHVGYRWYDPDTGRFLQRDPIGVSGGLNVYTYVENGPSWMVDPHGLQAGGGGIGTVPGRPPLPVAPGPPFGGPQSPGPGFGGIPSTGNPWQDLSNACGAPLGIRPVPPPPGGPPYYCNPPCRDFGKPHWHIGPQPPRKPSLWNRFWKWLGGHFPELS